MAVAGLTHAAWLARVPSALAECATAWGLTPGQAYAAGAGGHAIRAARADGTPAVLKLIHPHREAEQEVEVPWSGGSEYIQPHVDTVRWLLEGA